jgi:AP-4 complex subunit beta-1
MNLECNINNKKIFNSLLKNVLNDKDDKKKREVVKKVIAYMTLGIDVSRIFSEMCMASYTNDII